MEDPAAMKNLFVRAGITGALVSVCLGLAVRAEESRPIGGTLADRAPQATAPPAPVPATDLAKYIGNFNSGCTTSTWNPGGNGGCIFIACDSGCHAMECHYDSGYVDGFISLNCYGPSSGYIF